MDCSRAAAGARRRELASARAGDPVNGFGVVCAIGLVAFWLFGYDLPGGVQTGADSHGAHLLIWPALGADVWWPPRVSFAHEAELEQLARRMPAGTEVHGMPQL
jgi:hypothetical protein